MKLLTIAVDGYSGCGKSTIAKDIAKHLGYVFIDSGAMYRGVTLYALENGFIGENQFDEVGLIAELDEVHIEFRIHPEDAGKQHLYLNGRDVETEIRSLHVSGFVSQIATLAEVRQKMVDIQRRMGASGGVVMDGRDIGSVVFPNAELKFFVTAKPEVRAKRRQLELEQKGEHHSLADILQNLQERDAMDTSRANSPLIQVPDAIVIDTSDLTRESQLAYALSFVEKRKAM
jgi:cytidylate kinase